MENTKSNLIRNVLIAVIITMLIWQYVIPVLDDSIKTPSEYLNEIINPKLPNDLIFIPFVLNNVNNVKTTMPIKGIFPVYETNNYQMTEYTTYTIGINCDLPGKLIGYYSWNFIIQIKNETTSEIDSFPFSYRISGYECFFKNQWVISDESVFINYERDYIITMTLFDDDGTQIKTLSYIPNLTIYQNQFFLLKPVIP